MTQPRKLIELNGKQYTIHQLAELAGITEKAMRSRLRRKDNIADCLKHPGTKEKIYEYQGRQYTIKELAKKAKCSVAAMHKRISSNGIEMCMSPKRQGMRAKVYTHNGKQYTAEMIAKTYGVGVTGVRRNIRIYGIDTAVEMAQERKRIRDSQRQVRDTLPVNHPTNVNREARIMRTQNPTNPTLEKPDPDIELKRRIAAYRSRGWEDDEILAKLRAA